MYEKCFYKPEKKHKYLIPDATPDTAYMTSPSAPPSRSVALKVTRTEPTGVSSGVEMSVK